MKKIIKHIIIVLLYIEAKLILKKYAPTVIAVTGTVGKSTTKDMLYTALAPEVSVRKSPKSFNSEFGIPLTIIGEDNPWSSPIGWLRVLWKGLVLMITKQEFPEHLVLEIGADRPGDIKRAAKLVRPDIVVLTRFGTVPVHVEFFDSPREVFEEKMQLVRYMKGNGKVIANADDEELIKRVQNKVPAENIISIGKAENAKIRLLDMQLLVEDWGRYEKPIGQKLIVRIGEEHIEVATHGALGAGNTYPTLASLGLSSALPISTQTLSSNIEAHDPSRGRMRLIDGVSETLILDDSYNSSPVAFESALNTLEKLTMVRHKVVVTGDMLELGKYSSDEHKRIGEHVGKVADIIVTVGFRAKKIGERAKEVNPRIVRAHFDDLHLLGDYVKENIKKGDVILVKGSQGTRMEKVVKEIMAEPERAEELLVRQEKEWQER